jgi:hypothetical protein
MKQFGYADLRLNGLKTISPEAAEALAAHQGKVLLYSLEKLDSIPLAQKLARQWGELRLGLTELSAPIAAEPAPAPAPEPAPEKAEPVIGPAIQPVVLGDGAEVARPKRQGWWKRPG